MTTLSATQRYAKLGFFGLIGVAAAIYIGQSAWTWKDAYVQEKERRFDYWMGECADKTDEFRDLWCRSAANLCNNWFN